MLIEIHEGPIMSQIDHPELIKSWLVYDKIWYQQGRYAKVKRSYKVPLVSKKGFFLSGSSDQKYRKRKPRLKNQSTHWLPDLFEEILFVS